MAFIHCPYCDKYVDVKEDELEDDCGRVWRLCDKCNKIFTVRYTRSLDLEVYKSKITYDGKEISWEEFCKILDENKKLLNGYYYFKLPHGFNFATASNYEMFLPNTLETFRIKERIFQNLTEIDFLEEAKSLKNDSVELFILNNREDERRIMDMFLYNLKDRYSFQELLQWIVYNVDLKKYQEELRTEIYPKIMNGRVWLWEGEEYYKLVEAIQPKEGLEEEFQASLRYMNKGKSGILGKYWGMLCTIYKNTEIVEKVKELDLPQDLKNEFFTKILDGMFIRDPDSFNFTTADGMKAYDYMKRIKGTSYFAPVDKFRDFQHYIFLIGLERI